MSDGAVRKFYNRVGRLLDTQLFYEKQAYDDLVENLQFSTAHAVFEFGCGTGHLAAEILKRYMPPDSRYVGVDISPTMVRIARKRLADFSARAEVRLSDGTVKLDFPDGTFDGVISTYVLDILSNADARTLVDEAHRVLKPDGLLGLASLTRSEQGVSRIVTCAWERMYRAAPGLVGGCRPIDLDELFKAPRWAIRHRRMVAPFGVPTQVVVATPVKS